MPGFLSIVSSRPNWVPQPHTPWRVFPSPVGSKGGDTLAWGEGVRHSVYGVPGFLSSRPSWVPHPLTSKRMLPPPIWVQVGGHTRLREMGQGEPIRTKRQTLWYSRYRIIPLLGGGGPFGRRNRHSDTCIQIISLSFTPKLSCYIYV